MELYYHILTKHQISPPQGITFPSCKTCKFVAMDQPGLEAHEKEAGHSKPSATGNMTRSRAAGAVNPPATPVAPAPAKRVDMDEDGMFPCDMCDKSFATRKAVSMHRVAKHTRTRRTKIVNDDEEDEEETEASAEEDDEVDFDSALNDDVDYVPKSAAASAVATKKNKVQSNVVVSAKGKTKSSEAESLTTVATGIATSLRLGADEVVDQSTDSVEFEASTAEDEIVDEAQYIEEALASVHGESHKEPVIVGETTKFLAEDGTELQLTAAERAELISQLDTSVTEVDADKSGVEEGAVVYAEGDPVEDAITMGDESGEVLKDGDEVLMVYGGPRSDTKAKEDDLENSAGDVALKEEQPSMELEESDMIDDDDDEEKADKEKNKLIKELEGDWTDDAEDNGEEVGKATAEPVVVEKDVKPETEAVDTSVEEVKEEEIKSEEAVDPEKKELDASTDEIKSDLVVSEKKAPDATLAEFMNDWEDE